MAIKTKQHEGDVMKFIDSFAPNEQSKQDSYELVKFMEKMTGHPPKMWGPSIIGFGKYHYKSDRSKQEGDWPLIGFSPRKTAISLYTYTGAKQHEYLLKDLGKFKIGKACIYVKKLADIDLSVLEKMIKETIQFLEEKYGKV